MRDRFNEFLASGMSVQDARKEVDATLGVEFRSKASI
jgi:hypothetical protein